MKWTKERRDYMWSLVNLGLSQRQIAKVMKTTIGSIAGQRHNHPRPKGKPYLSEFCRTWRNYGKAA